MTDMVLSENIENKNGLAEVLINRQSKEVQASMIMAKQFPRDELSAYNKIRNACKRRGLAEQAEYCYPRGGQKVIGPSIRLAETLAQNWGNIDYGVIELNRKQGSSEMMAYAWDLETNTRRTMVFSVEHVREKKTGTDKLTDTRDIYELTANMGARRVRSCILSIIPGDIVDDAILECQKTLSGAYTEPLRERCKKMLATFDDDFKVSKEMIEKYFGYNIESLSEGDYNKLRSIYNSLKDGMTTRESWFEIRHKATSSLDFVPTKENKDIKDKKSEKMEG